VGSVSSFKCEEFRNLSVEVFGGEVSICEIIASPCLEGCIKVDSGNEIVRVVSDVDFVVDEGL
jgi:hypothetical protein